MNIFITGANGLLGSNLIRVLINKGHNITAFVLNNTRTDTIDQLPINLKYGNILDYKSLHACADGIDAIFHLAASTALWPERDELINKINVEGTKNIIKLSEELKVKRLVYVGTANSFSFGSKKNPGVEDSDYLAHKYGFNYMDSKFKAQKLVLEAVKNGLQAVVVNPTFMLGKFDTGPSSGAMIVAIYNKKVPGYAPGGKNYICVKDAAIGISNALSMGRVGQCYIIGNENLSYKEAFQKIANIVKVNPPNFTVPKFGLLIFGLINTLFSKISGKKPTVSYGMAKISCDEHYFSPAKAVRELKLPQSPIEEGIQECFDWLKANSYLN